MTPKLSPETLARVDLTLSVFDHAVRKLRKLRSLGITPAELEAYAASMKRTLFIDVDQALAQSRFPGPTNGYPFLANAELKAAEKRAS